MEWFSPNLNADELKKEYKKLARQYHPDISKDPDAEEKMKEINYQFDEYYAHQVRFEYTWASEARARQEAHKVRKAELVRMYWNKDFGHYTTKLLHSCHSGWLGFQEDYIIGHAIDEPGEYTWEDFKGGLAYVGYEWGSNYAYGRGIDEVNCKRLPAEIIPATPEEIYWYNKDHWLDTGTDVFLQADCKFGRVIFYINGANADKIQFYAKNEQERYARVYGNMLMKCTLPDEFLIGNKDPNTNAEYEARSIQMVNVRIGSCGTLRNVISLTGEDFPYMVYQQCTVADFMKFHDMYLPQFADITPMHKVPVGMLTGERDPIVDYLHRKGILEVWRYNQNFRVCCGCFNKRMLEQNMELTTIEDVELAQDYLDIINTDFVESAKTLLKRGRITMKI